MTGSSESVRAVVLVGFMGAGKTSVGHILGEKLGWAFEDLDRRIEQREGKTVAQIFADSGEEEFRRLERESLQELLHELHAGRYVIALGGGAFVQDSIANLIESAGIRTVFLDAGVEQLLARCEAELKRQGAKRPLLENRENFRRLYEARRPFYLKAAWRKETEGKTVEQIAFELIQDLGLVKAPQD
jgi:shikimate kinase